MQQRGLRGLTGRITTTRKPDLIRFWCVLYVGGVAQFLSFCTWWWSGHCWLISRLEFQYLNVPQHHLFRNRTQKTQVLIISAWTAETLPDDGYFLIIQSRGKLFLPDCRMWFLYISAKCQHNACLVQTRCNVEMWTSHFMINVRKAERNKYTTSLWTLHLSVRFVIFRLIILPSAWINTKFAFARETLRG